MDLIEVYDLTGSNLALRPSWPSATAMQLPHMCNLADDERPIDGQHQTRPTDEQLATIEVLVVNSHAQIRAGVVHRRIPAAGARGRGGQDPADQVTRQAHV